MKVYVVTDSSSTYEPIQGVYSTSTLANLAAAHPWSSLEVIEFDLITPEDVKD